ncbi:hypothetical protein PTI98_008312 [Pleurotus ostreatus]|nr:hypothetical protein PTI98_008312 [Pleurotus ostreatus]
MLAQSTAPVLPLPAWASQHPKSAVSTSSARLVILAGDEYVSAFQAARGERSVARSACVHVWASKKPAVGVDMYAGRPYRLASARGRPSSPP